MRARANVGEIDVSSQGWAAREWVARGRWVSKPLLLGNYRLTFPCQSPGGVSSPGATMWSSQTGWEGSVADRHPEMQQWWMNENGLGRKTFVERGIESTPVETKSHIDAIKECLKP